MSRIIKFLEYNFFSDALCLGERIKGLRLRPSCHIIRYSQLVGALRAEFGHEFDAAGVIDSPPPGAPTVLIPSTLTRRLDEKAVVPIQVEVLTEVRGRIYIVLDENLPSQFRPESKDFLQEFHILLGALSHRGLGKTKLTFEKSIDLDLDAPCKRIKEDIDSKLQTRFEGTLCTRIPLKKTINSQVYENIPSRFGIDIQVPFYGYLFNPLSEVDGEYVLSIYEKSKIIGPLFLTEEGRK